MREVKMKKFSRASREITVTLICILACFFFFSVFDIAEGRCFQRLLISAGGSWPLAGEGRFEVILGPDPAYICRPQRRELGGGGEDIRHLRHACTVELGTLRYS